MQFLRQVFATILGIFATFFIILILVVATLVSTSRTGGERIPVKDNSILRLNFSSPIKEVGEENPFEGLGNTFSESSIGLKDILAAIKRAKKDDRIKGIYFEIMEVGAGYASVQEIRDALLDFKTSGKFVYAYGEYMSEKAYYLASVADKLYLHPLGLVEFNGLSSKVVFFKKMFEKVGIEPEIFRVGEYKSAVEPFMLEKMSEANRLQTKSYLTAMYDVYLNNLSASLGISKERLMQISDSMLVRNAGDAVKYKLVTDTFYYDQVEAELKKVANIEEDEKVEFVSFKRYSRVRLKEERKQKSDNEIAVVIAEGEIVPGKGMEGYIGSDDIAKKLRKLRKDEKVKAVVLRINSPGGSALASDVMWREVRLMSEKKPIIASMSDVAASGGYYMAMGCDKIVAQPNTITGSIGIFGLLFNVKKLLEEKIGITSEVVGTGRLSDFGDPTDGLTDMERKIIQKMVDEGYETFTSKAALGRKMSLEELKKYASGRVWAGTEAKNVGLVDELGGVDKAIELAAQQAGVENDYCVKYYPEEVNFLDKLNMQFQEDIAAWLLKKRLGEYYPIYQQVEKIKNLYGIQARLPHDIVIE